MQRVDINLCGNKKRVAERLQEARAGVPTGTPAAVIYDSLLAHVGEAPEGAFIDVTAYVSCQWQVTDAAPRAVGF